LRCFKKVFHLGKGVIQEDVWSATASAATAQKTQKHEYSKDQQKRTAAVGCRGWFGPGHMDTAIGQILRMGLVPEEGGHKQYCLWAAMLSTPEGGEAVSPER
jgi:hypothetical protein